MSDSFAASAGAPESADECSCGAPLPGRRAPYVCTECGVDCCPSCAFWLESTVYCPGCTDRLLAA